MLHELFELFDLTEAGYGVTTGKASCLEEGNKNYGLIIYIHLQMLRM